MTLEQLRIFVAVAEREHLTKAAHELRLTPSAVSAAIKALETRYGIRLLHRVGRRIELTECARRFLPEARSTLASARAAELALSELGGELRGTLVVWASQTIASYWLPPFLARFHEVHPTVDLRMEVGNTRSVAAAVRDGEADIGYVEGEIDDPLLSARIIAHDRLVVVVAPGHPWAAGRPVRASELAASRWVMRESGSGTRAAFENFLHSLNVDCKTLDIALVLPSNEAVRSAVSAGCYASVVSERVVQADLQAGRLVRVGLDIPMRAFRLLRHRQRYHTRASVMLEMVIEQAA